MLYLNYYRKVIFITVLEDLKTMEEHKILPSTLPLVLLTWLSTLFIESNKVKCPILHSDVQTIAFILLLKDARKTNLDKSAHFQSVSTHYSRAQNFIDCTRSLLCEKITWEEWWIHQKAVLPFSVTWTGWKVGQRGT